MLTIHFSAVNFRNFHGDVDDVTNLLYLTEQLIHAQRYNTFNHHKQSFTVHFNPAAHIPQLSGQPHFHRSFETITDTFTRMWIVTLFFQHRLVP
jgi:hypothetical protein